MLQSSMRPADSTLRGHIDIIKDTASLNNRVGYSLTCLVHAIAHANTNRLANSNFLLAHLPTLNALLPKANRCSHDQLLSLLTLFNSVLVVDNTLTQQQQAQLVEVIRKSNLTRGAMSEALCQEIIALCSMLKYGEQQTKVLMDIMAQKMNAEQALDLLLSFRSSELYSSEAGQLIELGEHYNTNQMILGKILQGLHWQVSNTLRGNKDRGLIGQNILSFVKHTLGRNPSQFKIKNLCSVVYNELSCQKVLSGNAASQHLHLYLTESEAVPLIPHSQQMVRQPHALISIIEEEPNLSKHLQFQYLLTFYAKQGLLWRNEVKESLKNGKSIKAKEFLLRATQGFDVTLSESRGIQITPQEEKSFSEWLPVQSLRTVEGVYHKLKLDPTPANAIQTIRNMDKLPRNHSLYEQILLILLEIAVQNKQYASLGQVFRLVKEEISGQKVVARLKVKGSIKDIDSNRASKRYFMMVPLVCSRAQAQSVSDELCEIVNHQTISINLKLFLAEFLLSKMILKPAKYFISYLTRYLDSSFTPALGQALLSYLRPHSQGANLAVADWLSRHFSDDMERLSEFFFAKLVSPQMEEVAKLLFMLEKFNMYGSNWLHVYRWILAALQDVNESYPTHTLDCLQLLQMVVEKVPRGGIPSSVTSKFRKIVTKNWGKYNHDHMFALDRIIQLLSDHSAPVFAERPLPSLTELQQQQRQFDDEHKFYRDELKVHPVTKYVASVAYNVFMGHSDSEDALDKLLQVYGYFTQEHTSEHAITRKNLTIMLHCILFLYQDAEDTIDQRVDSFILDMLQSKHYQQEKGWLEIQGRCLSFLSKVPHSINLLKLPLQRLTRRGFYEKNWLNCITEIVNIITEAKPKALLGLGLEQVLRSIIRVLVGLQDSELTEEYLDLIEACCLIDEGYESLLGEMLPVLVQVLRAQRWGVGYRSSLVEFVVNTLLDYDHPVPMDIVWFLLRKYVSEAPIVQLLLEYFEKNKIDPNSIDNKLLVRLVLEHNQHETIQEKCKELFQTYVPRSTSEEQLVQCLSNAKYERCQQIVGDVANPYGLNISLIDIKSLLEWKETPHLCKKLLRFLYEHPQTQSQIFQCQAFILNPEYLSFIKETLSQLVPTLVPHQFKVTPAHKASFAFRPNEQAKALYHTLARILTDKNSQMRLRALMLDLFKQAEDDLSVLCKFMVSVLSRFPDYDAYPQVNTKAFYGFLNGMVGQLELIDAQKVGQYMLSDLTFVFPESLSDQHLKNSHYSSCLLHYCSLIRSFSLIEKEIGSHKYVNKVTAILVRKHNQADNKAVFVEHFLKSHLSFGGADYKIDSKKMTEETKQQAHLLRQLLSSANESVKGLLQQGSGKIGSDVVTGYASYLLYLHNQGVSFDVLVSETLQSLWDDLDSVPLGEAKETTVEAIKWLLGTMGVSPTRREVKPSHKTNEGAYRTHKKEKQEAKQQVIPPPPITHSQQVQLSPTKSVDIPPYLKEPEEAGREKEETEIRKEIEESYQKYKEIEEYISVKGQEEEGLKPTIEPQRVQEVIAVSEPQIFTQNVEKPREQTFNEERFYDTAVQKSEFVTEAERAQNLRLVHEAKHNDASIHALKEHLKFIATLVPILVINKKELEQLLKSSKIITDTVSSHSFYAKKANDAETVGKLIKIYKNMFSNGLKAESEELVGVILGLSVAMSAKKEKRMVMFQEEETVQFFKMVIKRSLNGQHDPLAIQGLLGVLYCCRNSTQVYFQLGLLSMVIELIKREMSVEEVLHYLIRIDLTQYIINEIYQRGLFNKLVAALSQGSKASRREVSLWIRLAGKVCINPSIQAKFMSKQLHLLVWGKWKMLVETEERLNICYLLAYMCLKNEEVNDWLIESKVLEELLPALKNQRLNDDLYLLFYHFCFNSGANRDYCFRIKYHVHLMERLNQRDQDIRNHTDTTALSKYYFKSLGQLMTSKLYLLTFFKELTVMKLIYIFEFHAQPCILQCLLDLISTLESDAEFDELKRQNFWDMLKVFEYKISSEATYSYLLQIFLIMIKKGRTREFNQQDIRNKACLKAEYSINMEGKELALRFILALSIKNKDNYLNERCVRLLSSIMGLTTTLNELQLAHDMLKIQGNNKDIHFLDCFVEQGIHTFISDNLQRFNPQEMEMAVLVLGQMACSPNASHKICGMTLPLIFKTAEESSGKLFKQCLQTIAIFGLIRDNRESFQLIEIQAFLENPNTLDKVRSAQADAQYAELVDNLTKNNFFSEMSVQRISERARRSNISLDFSRMSLGQEPQRKMQDVKAAVNTLRTGRRVRMYKVDGSISELMIFISADCLEINCGLTVSEVVKQKWRLPINEVVRVVEYPSQESPVFANSYFEKNTGFFGTAPSHDCCLSLEGKHNQFHICFGTALERIEWKGHFSMARDYAKNMLLKLANK